MSRKNRKKKIDKISNESKVPDDSVSMIFCHALGCTAKPMAQIPLKLNRLVLLTQITFW